MSSKIMSSGYYKALHSFFAITSFFGLIILCNTIRKELNRINVINIALQLVYVITITLGIFTFSQLCFILPGLFDLTYTFQNNFSGKIACTVISGLGNFACVSSVLWYATVAWMLLMLLNGYSGIWVEKTITRQHVIIWTTSLILGVCEFWPYVVSGNPLHYCNAVREYRDKIDDIVFYVPIISTMLLSAIVLINSLYLLKRQKTILDITIFVGCFIIVWLLPTTRTIIQWSGYTYSLLDDLCELAFSLTGIAHVLVWKIISHPKGRNVRIIETVDDIFQYQHMRHHSLLISTLCVRSEQTHDSLYGSTFESDYTMSKKNMLNSRASVRSDGAERSLQTRFSRSFHSDNTFQMLSHAS